MKILRRRGASEEEAFEYWESDVWAHRISCWPRRATFKPVREAAIPKTADPTVAEEWNPTISTPAQPQTDSPTTFTVKALTYIDLSKVITRLRGQSYGMSDYVDYHTADRKIYLHPFVASQGRRWHPNIDELKPRFPEAREA